MQLISTKNQTKSSNLDPRQLSRKGFFVYVNDQVVINDDQECLRF